MSAIHWSGPYCSAQTESGGKLDWDPLADRRPPRGAVKFVVRWRVTGFVHPRKRTFTGAAEAEELARHIEVARVLRSDCDADGLPTEPTSTADGPPHGAGRAGHRADPQAPDEPALAGTAAAPRPTTAPAHMTPRNGLGGQSDSRGIVDPLGRDVAGYIDELIELHQPSWEQQGNQGRGVRWWVDQLAFVKAVLRYDDTDERLGYCGIAPGDSLHFRLLGQRDFNRALRLRRTVNLRTGHHNRQRQEKFERDLAKYEAKLAVWQAREGHKGRKPVAPQPPKVEVAVSDGQVLVGTHAEKAFRTALSFVFDRAFDAGLFPPGPNPYRQWNPRGSGGRHASRRSPFRKVEKPAADSRDYPGLGFFVDLGDELAKRGKRLPSGLRAGERYRALPLAWVQLAPRPGEGCLLRAEDLDPDGGTALITPEPDGHLKAREKGEVRTAPLSRLVAGLLADHIEAGLAGPDGTLFLSPEGAPLDTGNFYEKYLRPAVASLSSDEDGLWPTYPALAQAEFYDLRKAGITTWVTYGADTYEAARWSGHTEHELLTSYRGVIAGVGRRAVWKDVDTMVEQALLDHPPRGDGPLARHLRAWLGL